MRLLVEVARVSGRPDVGLRLERAGLRQMERLIQRRFERLRPLVRRLALHVPYGRRLLYQPGF